jgi:hypothetical protein
MGYVGLLLGASTMTAIVTALLLTERSLPPRASIAFGVMAVMGLSWVVWFEPGGMSSVCRRGARSSHGSSDGGCNEIGITLPGFSLRCRTALRFNRFLLSSAAGAELSTLWHESIVPSGVQCRQQHA